MILKNANYLKLKYGIIKGENMKNEQIEKIAKKKWLFSSVKGIIVLKILKEFEMLGYTDIKRFLDGNYKSTSYSEIGKILKTFIRSGIVKHDLLKRKYILTEFGYEFADCIDKIIKLS